MRSPKIPDGAEIVQSFGEYRKLCDAFLDNRFNLMVVVGRPGLSKSHYFEEQQNDLTYLIKGWASPLQVYMDLYFNRNKLIILDDAEVLWSHKTGRVLMRSLTEHKARKLVQWATRNKDLDKAGVERKFVTSSKVAIIANRFIFGDADEYEAILDRAHLIYFDPTPIEVHRDVGRWFWDQDIYDFVGDRLCMMEGLSARTYTKAWERKQARGNWKKMIEERYCFKSTMLVVQDLEIDAYCRTVKERELKFIQRTGCSRATYYNLKKRLQSSDQLVRRKVSTEPLTGKPPVELDLEEEVMAALEEMEVFGEEEMEEEEGEYCPTQCLDD